MISRISRASVNNKVTSKGIEKFCNGQWPNLKRLKLSKIVSLN